MFKEVMKKRDGPKFVTIHPGDGGPWGWDIRVDL
jgi:hypothetical protein